MITAVHTLIYSTDPEATRAFLRDVLGWPSVSTSDDEPEWLIFKSGPSEMGVHPTDGMGHDGHSLHLTPRHQVTLMCADLPATMTALAGRGATFRSEPRDEGFGVTVQMAVPGAGDMMLYEPRHRLAYTL